MSEFEWEYFDLNDIDSLEEDSEYSEYYFVNNENHEMSSWESYYDDIAEEIEY